MMVDHKAKKMFCENIGLLWSRSMFKFLFVCLSLDDNFLTAEPLVTKLGMVIILIYHH